MKCILVDPKRLTVNIAPDKNIIRAQDELIAFPPTGISYIAAFLRQNGVDVRIIDAKTLNMPHVKVAEAVAEERADFVGLTVFTTNLRSALDTCRAIRQLSPSTKIVLGGPHIDPKHDEVIREDCVDVCVRGEGEETMLELAQAFSNGGDLRRVAGITFEDGDNAVINPDRPKIQDLDTLPFPARDLLPNHLYNTALGDGATGSFAAITAQRGCPFKCKFCSVPSFYPRQRRRSVGNILDEMEEVHDKYQISYVRFTDEILPIDRKWAMELFNGMIERGLNKKIAWSCDNRVDLVRREVLEKMKEAGCACIFYGIEFGNQRILDFARKGTTIEQIYQAVDMTVEVGIAATGNFMIGYPTETEETINDTIELAKNLNVTDASFSIVTPFPGTALCDYCKENRLLHHENWQEYNYFHPGHGYIKLEYLSDEDLMRLYQKAEFEYQFRQVSREIKEEVAAWR